VTLPEFIASMGDDKAAALFDEPVRTVMSWRHGARRPRPAKAQKIVERSEGKVTFADIYAERAA
jgi:hypothetical protein